MTECRMELDEMLKPGTVKHLLKKREILLSIVEDVTQGNVQYSQRFKDYDKLSQADIQHHVKDIPQLEKEVEELTETVKAMAEQRGVDRAAMLIEVQQLYGTPLHAITERQRRSISAKDSKKALPLLVKLVQNLYLQFTTNYKWRTLLQISIAFQREERSGFRGLLREAPYCKGSDRQGLELAAEIDLAAVKRLVGFLMQKLAFMRAVDEDPLGDMTEVPSNTGELNGGIEPSYETIAAVCAGPNPHFREQIDALKEKFGENLKRRSEARIPLVTAAHMVFHAPFGISFQLANDTHINKLPLNECKQALQAFVKAAQNVYEEITIWGKEDVGLQREVDFNTLERNLYKYAYLGLLEKIDAQFASTSSANVDERNGSTSTDH